MLFQTTEFLVLLLAVFVGVSLLRRPSGQQTLLLMASYLFYGWWDVRFLMLLLLSTAIDYTAARGMSGRLPWAKRGQITLSLLLGGVAFLAFDWSIVRHWPQTWSWASLVRPDFERTAPVLVTLVTAAALLPFVVEPVLRLPAVARRRTLLGLSVASNLGMLGYFKYHDFFAENYAGLATLFGSSSEFEALSVALPVGISFYTFQTLSYTIDVSRGELAAETSFRRLALYVSYFPQLVAGPIMRPQTFLPTLRQPWTLREDRLISGFHLAAVGLVKKLVIADAIAPLVSVILDDPVGRPSLAIWLGTILFAIQIYCDFSGYTDLARGISRMLGVEIPLNFDGPYLATSVADFWRRWHISLSSWLRDYLYIPLGGNRGGELRVSGNLLVTMLLGGLWHGAAWNFVIWGGYQGVLLCGHRQFRRWCHSRPRLDRWLRSRPGTFIRWGVTMYAVALGWLIFRVGDLTALASAVRSFVVFDGRLSPAGLGLGQGAPFTALIAATAFVVLHAGSRLTPRTWPERLDAMPPRWQPVFGVLLGAGLFFTWPSGETPFVYFQF